MMKRYGWLVGVMLGWLLVNTWQAPAQDSAINLKPFEPVSGQLQDGNLQQTWRFEGTANQVISLQVITLDGDLNPVLTLLAEDGTILATNDDSALQDNSARLEGIPLPDDGVYVVRVARDGLGRGTTSGTYELTLLEGAGSIPFANHTENYRLWLTRDIRSAQQILPPLPAANFYWQAPISLQGDNYQVEWLIRQPQNDESAWRFSWTSDGTWSLAVLNAAGQVLSQEQATSDLLLETPVEGLLVFEQVGNQFTVRFRGETLTSTTLADTAILSADTQLSVNFSLLETLPDQPTTALAIANTDISEIYYSTPAELVAIPPIANEVRLFSYNDTPQAIIDELIEREIIPYKGIGIQARVADSYIFTDEVGFSAFPIINERPYADFVLGYTASLSEGTLNTACGVLFRQEEASNNFASALFTPNQDLYFLNYTEGEIGADSILMRTPLLAPGLRQSHQFILVAFGDRGTLYLNGRMVGQIELTSPSGKVFVQTVLDEEQNAYCLLRNVWLWEIQ